MPQLNDYEKILVVQRQQDGCIAASFEWFLKYRNISLGTNWDIGFQEKVNCHAQNHYSSVADKIAANFVFDRERIKSSEYDAMQKCTEIKRWIDTGKGCLVSLPSGSNFHIMPAVEIENMKWIDTGKTHQVSLIFGRKSHIVPAVEYDIDTLTLLNLEKPLPPSSQKEIYLWSDVIESHNKLKRGRDICWLNDEDE